MLRNIDPLLTRVARQRLELAVLQNVAGLFQLGDEHLAFALAIDPGQWRHRISRLYYAGYNIRRAVLLCHDGSYSTDSSDHQAVNVLPDDFNERAKHGATLKTLREDRNLADYNHDATRRDLLQAPDVAESLIQAFRQEAVAYVRAKGVNP
jgi:hypothetical protein